ncbi:MAG: hypothetical protein ACI3XJ_09005, partial [Oscillospiraceae bacterium]
RAEEEARGSRRQGRAEVIQLPTTQHVFKKAVFRLWTEHRFFMILCNLFPPFSYLWTEPVLKNEGM